MAEEQQDLIEYELDRFEPLEEIPYEFDNDRFDYGIAVQTIRFIESVCYVPEGSHAGRPMRLRWWQRRLILDVYRIERASGRRLVRHSTLSVARKQGKTALLAALCIAHLCGPLAVTNGELSSAGKTRDQASMLFRYMAHMVRLSHRLVDRLKIVDSRKMISDPVSGSHYTALSADARAQLGRSPVVFFYDELGAMRSDRDLYDALMTGQGAHDNPLAWVLSTQAPSDADLLSELIDYSLKNPEDETYHLSLYTIPEEDDAYDPGNWAKANPALGDFLNLDDFAKQAAKARKMPGARNAFLNLRCNRRVDILAHFLSREAWEDKVYSAPPTFEDIRGDLVFVGIDLAMRRDLAAVVFVSELEDGILAVVPAFFLPVEAVKEREEYDKAPYQKWVEMDLLTLTPGNALDFDWVAKWMLQVVQEFDLTVAGGGYDRYKFDHLMQSLEDIGADVEFEMIEAVGQGYVSMSPAVDLMESLVYENRLWHGDHPLLTWNVANCVITKDPAGNRKLDKSKAAGKIDGAVALAMALRAWDLEETIGLVGQAELIFA